MKSSSYHQIKKDLEARLLPIIDTELKEFSRTKLFYLDGTQEIFTRDRACIQDQVFVYLHKTPGHDAQFSIRIKSRIRSEIIENVCEQLEGIDYTTKDYRNFTPTMSACSTDLCTLGKGESSIHLPLNDSEWTQAKHWTEHTISRSILPWINSFKSNKDIAHTLSRKILETNDKKIEANEGDKMRLLAFLYIGRGLKDALKFLESEKFKINPSKPKLDIHPIKLLSLLSGGLGRNRYKKKQTFSEWASTTLTDKKILESELTRWENIERRLYALDLPLPPEHEPKDFHFDSSVHFT